MPYQNKSIATSIIDASYLINTGQYEIQDELIIGSRNGRDVKIHPDFLKAINLQYLLVFIYLGQISDKMNDDFLRNFHQKPITRRCKENFKSFIKLMNDCPFYLRTKVDGVFDFEQITLIEFDETIKKFDVNNKIGTNRCRKGSCIPGVFLPKEMMKLPTKSNTLVIMTHLIYLKINMKRSKKGYKGFEVKLSTKEIAEVCGFCKSMKIRNAKAKKMIGECLDELIKSDVIECSYNIGNDFVIKTNKEIVKQ